MQILHVITCVISLYWSHDLPFCQPLLNFLSGLFASYFFFLSFCSSMEVFRFRDFPGIAPSTNLRGNIWNHLRSIPEIEYYFRNCACVRKLRVGTGHGTSRTFGPEKDRSLSVRPIFYLSGPSDRRYLGKTGSDE